MSVRIYSSYSAKVNDALRAVDESAKNPLHSFKIHFNRMARSGNSMEQQVFAHQAIPFMPADFGQMAYEFVRASAAFQSWSEADRELFIDHGQQKPEKPQVFRI